MSDASIARFVDYITLEKGLSPLTIQAYRSDLAQLQQCLGSRQLITAGRRDIGDFIAKLLAGQIEARSVARKISTFREFFKFLLLDRIIKADPMVRIESLKIGRALPKALTVAEMATVLQELGPTRKAYGNLPDESLRLRDHAILELLYASGLRASEIIGAKLADLNLIERYITVHGKGDKERIAPFGHRAADALNRYLLARHDSPWLFPGRHGEHLTRERIWQIVKDVSQIIGRKVSPHMLRHSCATHLMEAGANLRVIQEILGHADIGTTELYTHVTTERLRKIYSQCHPRMTGKSRQLKLQLDLIAPASLIPNPAPCIECASPAVEGKARCERHLLQGKARGARKRKDHICVVCSRPATAGRTLCELHLSQSRESSRRYRAKKRTRSVKIPQSGARKVAA